MVTLSTDRINSISPYKVMAMEKANYVTFITDNNIRYVVGFDPTEVFTRAEAYQFYITNTDHKKSPRDSKLKETIMAVVTDFFQSNNTAMVYICDTGDGKQAMRNRLFKYWLVESPYYSNISTASGCVIDEDGVKNYAAIVVRNDHPKMREIMDEFFEVIDFLNNKPTH